MKLPLEFTERMQRILGSEYAAFEKSYEQPRKYGLRVNTAKIAPEEFERIAPFHLSRIPWIPGGYFYEEQDAPARHPFYYAGLYYLQEPSAMTPASVLDVKPGDRVLDLCAAPGGKATALGAKLKGGGILVANDISASRCKALLKNLEVFGISNALVTNGVPARLRERFPNYFDRILLDAPCSGEGMFRKDEDTIRAWYPEKPEECAKIQRDLILQAADMLRPGGKLLYSTCTFAPVENEEVIRFLLEQRPDMELLEMPEMPGREGFAPGLDGLDRCVRLWPHRLEGEGHFLALLGKAGDNCEAFPGSVSGEGEASLRTGSEKQRKKKNRGRLQGEDTRRTNREDAAVLEEFFANILTSCGKNEENFPEQQGHLEEHGGQVYWEPFQMPKADGIPFLRRGLYLGELRKERFEPSQSLALALDPEQCAARCDFAPDDERVIRYLRGETVELNERETTRDSGWMLVCVAGYPLGWGKLVRGLLKNKYHPGWRMKS